MLRSFIRKTPLIRGGNTWSRCVYYLQTISDNRLFSNSTNTEFNQEISSISQQNETDNNQRLSENTEVRNEKKTGMPSVPIMDRHPEDLYRRYFMTPDQPPNARLLRVAIVGAPNAGKSTLINTLVGWKLNSVSTKVHTTKQNANSMFTIDNAQIIFVDTPGVITRTERKRYSCDGKMLSEPQRGVEEADIVGVVVDVSNKWTKNQVHKELLKVLYLHRDIPSFLILNKIDCMKKHSVTKQQKLLLDITSRLTEGELANKKLGRSKIEKKKQTKPENLFEQLEQKYGELKVKRNSNLKDIRPSKVEIDPSENLEKQFQEMNKQKVADYLTTWLQVDFKAKGIEGILPKIDRSKRPESWRETEEKILLKSDDSEKLKSELLEMFEEFRNKDKVTNGTQRTSSSDSSLGHSTEPLVSVNKEEKNKGDENETVEQNLTSESNTGLDKLADVDNDDCHKVGESKAGTNDIEHVSRWKKMEIADIIEDKFDNKFVNIELEESYQSEFLTRILSKPHEVFTDRTEIVKEDTEMKEKIMEVKAAIEAVKDKNGWSGFDEVFPVCALDGQGIGLLKEYLLKKSKPGDWMFHSSVITDQHPFELAQLCVTQSLLDNVETRLPYVVKPEIVYWDVDEYDRLNISVDVVLKDGYEMRTMLGENASERIKEITRCARQALMDAFQCGVRFKLSIKLQKKRGSR